MTTNKYKKNWEPFNEYKDLKVAEEYDQRRFSSLSGRVFDSLEKSALRKIFAGLSKDSLVLDAPSGTGRLAETLLEMGFRVVGLDISEAMLTVARRKLARFGDRYQTVCTDVRNWDRPPNTFDSILTARVLMHYPLDEQIEFLKPLVRLTKGPLVFNQSLVTDYHRARRAVKRLLRNQAPAAFPLTPTELRQLTEGSNLRIASRVSVCPPLSEAVFFNCERRGTPS